jgi:hypothetical protein
VDKEFYLGLLDQISDGVYFVARDRHITYWNGGAERRIGTAALSASPDSAPRRSWATAARKGCCVTSMTRAASSVCVVAHLRQ